MKNWSGGREKFHPEAHSRAADHQYKDRHHDFHHPECPAFRQEENIADPARVVPIHPGHFTCERLQDAASTIELQAYKYAQWRHQRPEGETQTLTAQRIPAHRNQGGDADDKDDGVDELKQESEEMERLKSKVKSVSKEMKMTLHDVEIKRGKVADNNVDLETMERLKVSRGKGFEQVM